MCDSWGNAGIREAIRPPLCERRIPKTFPSDQCVDANRIALHGLAPESGAGDGNRKYRSDTQNPLKSGHYEIGEALRVIIV